MERSKALVASALVAVGLTVGAGIYVAGSGLLAGATDNVGNLQPTVAETTVPATPQEITVYVDPATGAATTVAPTAVPAVGPAPIEAPPVEAAAPAATVEDSDDSYENDDRYEDDDRHEDDHGEDRSDDHGGEDGGEDDD